jgi:hypothetical protein
LIMTGPRPDLVLDGKSPERTNQTLSMPFS